MAVEEEEEEEEMAVVGPVAVEGPDVCPVAVVLVLVALLARSLEVLGRREVEVVRVVTLVRGAAVVGAVAVVEVVEVTLPRRGMPEAGSVGEEGEDACPSGSS